jgi:dihydrofolate reductase
LEIGVIVAISQNGVIGRDGKLPWEGKLQADMEHFKKLTIGSWVIMGRKTYLSIPARFRPLPKRMSVVLTRGDDLGWVGPFVEWSCEAQEVLDRHAEAVPYILIATGIDEALRAISEVDPAASVFIIGGAEVFAQTLERSDVRHLSVTTVQAEFDGNVRLSIDLSSWKLVNSEKVKPDQFTKYPCQFDEYVRK